MGCIATNRRKCPARSMPCANLAYPSPFSRQTKPDRGTPMPAELPPFPSPATFAAAVDLSASTVRRLVRLGRLPSVRIGDSLRIDRDAWLRQTGRISARAANRSADAIRAELEAADAALKSG